MSSDIIRDADDYRTRLFGHYDSALAYTDPEFVQIFENFAFGDVVRDSKLDDRTRFLAILAALMGSQGADAYRTMLPAALEVGVDPTAIKEVVYQGVAYLGLARVLPYIIITNEVLRGRSVKLPLPDQKTATRDEHLRRGNDLQVEIFGEGLRDAWEQGPEDTAHIRRWLAANCFGDYYTRGGLELRERELVTFCYLVALGGCEAQTTAHAGGNMRVGNGKELLIDVVSQLVPYIGYPRVLNAISCIEAAAEAE